jgi:hypothetical protein
MALNIFGLRIGFSDPSQDRRDLSILSEDQTAQNAAIREIASTLSPSIVRRKKQQRLTAAEESIPIASIAGGRKTVEQNQTYSAYNFWNDENARQGTSLWGLGSKFDMDALTTMPFDELAEKLSDLSPEVSKALWDFLLMCNSGYEVRAYIPGTEDLDEAATAELKSFIATLGRHNGTAGVFFDKAFKTAWLRGSNIYELILDRSGREFVDVATPDPKTLSFRRRNDPVRGQCWTYGQKQNGKFVDLGDEPMVVYIPIHPSPDSIEGHSLCASSFFLAIFLMAVLRDTKRVVQHQGYLRLDLEIDFDKIKSLIPPEVIAQPKKMKEAIDKIVNEIQSAYAKLEPDDAYIHSSVVTVNNPVGTVSADSLGAIDALFKALERMAVRALKTMPILMGTDQSRSETQANREYEIYAAGISAMQHYVESGMERVFQIALQAKGLQADVSLEFAKFRSAEEMRDQQTAFLKAKVARYLYDCGYISQDEAAYYAFGREKADAEEPRNLIPSVPGSGAPEVFDDPEPGQKRIKVSKERFETIVNLVSERQPTIPELDDADAFLEEYGDEMLQAMFDADVQAEVPEDVAIVQ